MKVRSEFDMCGNELKNSVAENRTDAPDSREGAFYYDKTGKCFKYYNGTGWVSVKPSDMFGFSGSDGVLTVTAFDDGKSHPPSIRSVKIIDPDDFDPAGEAAKQYGKAIAYAEALFHNLVGNAPEALDTIYELAVAVQNNKDLIESVRSLAGTTRKNKISNPELTPQNGVCTWNCAHLLGLKNNDSTLLCDVYESGTNEKVICDTQISGNTVIFKIASDVPIAAGKYYAVFIG